MAQAKIQTVTGTISPSELGCTLTHEHMLVGYAGWESDTVRPSMPRAEMIAVCEDRVAEMRDHGVKSMIDPCPSDLGRDVELLREVSSRTGLQVVCATGLYKEDQGGGAYWKFRSQFGDVYEAIAELYIHELTKGIGETDVKAGIIKVATGKPTITDYEHTLLKAAATASVETGAPITTHTEDGMLGDEQQRILVELGVPAHRINIGHSCGSDDTDYHKTILNGGSYMGFDRFGLEFLQPDEVRIASMLKLVKEGYARQLVVSHDSVWCWRGQPVPNPDDPGIQAMLEVWRPSHFFARIVPRLKDAGVTDEQIQLFVTENPRRLFAGDAIPESH